MARSVPKAKFLEFGKNIYLNISMIEPVLFLQGFEQKPTSEQNTVVLRGSLHVRVIRPSRIKVVTLRFQGKAVTKWPSGFPPNEITFEETNIITTKTWPFFNAQSLTKEAGVHSDQPEPFSPFPGFMPTQRCLSVSSANSSYKNTGRQKARRLSLQANSLWDAVKGESSTSVPYFARKAYSTFPPGDYFYDFELPLESSLPETIDLKFGSVKYELKATVERVGVFSTDLVQSKKVTLIRIPSQCGLEQVEPIAVCRTLGDRMKLDVTISGKSFPLGSKIPISINLTPLAKAQLHWIKVFATEHVEYLCTKRRAHRVEPARKIQLFEKRPDVPPKGSIPGSVSKDFIIGTKGIEFLVPLPRGLDMKPNSKALKLHSDTTFQNILVHHWIKIVIRLSIFNQTDPNKRRLLEISVDSPFRVLSHQVTNSVTTLPSYSAPNPTYDAGMQTYECSNGLGVCCAACLHFVPTSGLPSRPHEDSAATLVSSKLASHRFPQEVQTDGPADSLLVRPTYLFRAISFDPPAFEDEGPPLSLELPPPLYKSSSR